MIECIFSVDYEIYGNGEGSLRGLVYEAARTMMEVFVRHEAPFVLFVEAAELERIEEERADDAVNEVRHQIRDFHRKGFEIALHIHPQWCAARYEESRWVLDYGEYNLCALTQERIEQIVGRALSYLREVLDDPAFTPLAFRAGNWLFQPTEKAARVLAAHGIKIDSSVFKGGVQRKHGLDYRAALRNGYFWPFHRDVNACDLTGAMLEIPIYTEMVPFWKMLTAKRVQLQTKGASSARGMSLWDRLPDFLRVRYPLKLDFCRMRFEDMTSMMERIWREDVAHPEQFRPIVAIGHTKDLVDVDSVARFLEYLRERKIAIGTFKSAYHKAVRGTSPCEK